MSRYPGSGFVMKLRARSMALLDQNKQEANFGGKIILPPTALEQLARMTCTYPLMFSVQNHDTPSKVTHCGVLEFIAESGVCYLPHWMMQALGLDENSYVHVVNVSLPLATFVQLQPHTEDFLDISNPKAVLEKKLSSFSALTKGDNLLIEYNDREYGLAVIEVKSSGDREEEAVTIVECDFRLDMKAPPGYEEKLERLKREREQQEAIASDEEHMHEDEDDDDEEDAHKAIPESFFGVGNRLDGNKKKTPTVHGGDAPSVHIQHSIVHGTNVDELKKVEHARNQVLPFKFGKVSMQKARRKRQPNNDMDDGEDDAFTGEGNQLGKRA